MSLKNKISYCTKWVGNPPIHYCQYVEVWFDDKEFELFKAKCYQAFKNKYVFVIFLFVMDIILL